MTRSSTRRLVLSSAISLAFGTLVISVPAGAGEIILHEAVHDYSDTSGPFDHTDNVSTGRELPDRLTILDEARHDYSDVDFSGEVPSAEGLEQVEIAAFESGVQEPARLPWVITPLD